jgi:monoamine oxidase
MSKQVSRRTLVSGAAAGTLAAALPARAMGAPRRGPEKRVDVVVVGAGMAGLYAARQLRKAGRTVALLEASDRLGGRVFDLKVGPKATDIAESGAEWINSNEKRIQGLMKAFRLKTYKSYVQGQSTLIINGQVSRFNGATVPTLPGNGTPELIDALGKLTTMAQQVPIDAPWDAPDAVDWDTQTGKTWIDANIDDPVARDFASIVIGGPVSVQAADISLLHYLFIAAASGGPLNLVTINSGDLSDRIIGGPGRLVQGMAAPLRAVTSLNTPATMIERHKTRVRVTTPNGRWVAGDVIVAMSPTMTQQILFEPALSVQRNQSVQRTGQGSCIKAFPVYKTPFWRAQGLNGIIQSNSTPFSGVFDNSPADGSVGVLFALIENVAARRFGKLSADERKAEVLDGLALALGEEARHPVRYLEQDWAKEPWLRGGAAAFFAPGVLTEYRYLFGAATGRVHFAGTETGTAFWGNMEAALESGERAVKEILSR